MGVTITDVKEAVVEKICSSDRLPSVPAVAGTVISICASPDVDFAKLTSAVSADPALTAKLLRMANSSLFAGQTKVTSVQRALVRLGIKVTRMAVLGFALATEIQRKAPPEFDIDHFWRHALTTASAARIIAAATQFPRADDAFSAGLLQDVGVLAFQCVIPVEYAEVLAEYRSCPTEQLHEIEVEKLGATHMDVGSSLLRAWGVPSELCDPIRYHHDPEAVDAEDLPAGTSEMAWILSLGARIGRLFNEPGKGINHETLIHMAERQFGLSPETTTDALTQIEDAVRETATLFNVDPRMTPSYADIRNQAAREIARIAVEMGVEIRKHEVRAERGKREVHRLRKDNTVLKRQAVFDHLTNLIDRGEFMKRFGSELARSQREGFGVAVLLLDVDYFKLVNDRLGHLAGDEVLKALAAHMKAHVREKDLVARYGGDEFAVLFPQSQVETALEAAERLRLGVAKASKGWVDEMERITVSVGMAHVSPSLTARSATALLHEADQCLYAAKAAGRNCTRYKIM